MSVRGTKIFRAVILSTASIVLMAPSALAANPLLSGYGGPGQGSQVIIGGGLINPPGGGGSPTGASTASELTVNPAGEARANPATGRSHPSPKHSSPAPGTSKTGSLAPSTAVSAIPAASHLEASSSGAALGLSEGDALLVVFVLAALAVTALVTRRFSRRMP